MVLLRPAFTSEFYFHFFHNPLIGIIVATKKKTMYEILGVPPTALLAEIKAAHKRVSMEIMSGSLGLSMDDCKFQLSLLDVALHTLTTPYLRDAYDAELVPEYIPDNIVAPAKPATFSIVDKDKALMLATSMEETYKSAARSTTVEIDSYKPQIAVVSSVVNTSVKSLKTLMRVFIGLAVLAAILMVGRGAMGSRNGGHSSPEIVKAEEKLIIQEYFQKHGVRPASRAEAEFLEAENRRKENEQRAVAFEEKKVMEESSRFERESRREGDRILMANEREERRYQQEVLRKQQALEEETRRKEAEAQTAEDRRIANERRKLGLSTPERSSYSSGNED